MAKHQNLNKKLEKNTHLESRSKLFLIACILLVVSVLSIILISAVTYGPLLTYDNIDDSSVNYSLWKNLSIASGGTAIVSFAEDNDYMGGEAQATTSGHLATLEINSTNLTSLDRIQNISLKAYLSYNAAGGLTCSASLNVFGANAKTYSASTGSFADTSVWTIARNKTAGINIFDVFNDNVFDSQITGVNNVVSLRALGQGNGIAGSGTVRIYYLNYTKYSPITLNSPTNSTSQLPTVNFNCSANPFNKVDNVTLWIDGIANHTETFGSSNSVELYKTVNNLSIGDHIWSCSAYDNQTNQFWALSNNTLTISDFTENSFTYNATSFETKGESFIYNITTTGDAPSSVTFMYNGTSYSATSTLESGNTYILSKTLNVPIGTGTKEAYFNFNVGETEYNSTKYNQNINYIEFRYCNASINVTYINFTFKDEADSSAILAEIDSSSWVYYLGDGSVNKTYSYSNNAPNSSYGFCFNQAYQPIKVDLTLRYSNDSYPQRVYTLNNQQISNSTTNQVLYLLKTEDGIYVTFQVINQAEQPIANAFVNASRDIGGTSYSLGNGYTGNDGGVTFWLNPNYAHTITVNATGYNYYSTTITPTQSGYTLTLGSTTIVTDYDYSKGILEYIYPQVLSLYNDTIYNFNYTLSSSYWEISEFGFTITNSSGYSFGSVSASTNGGIVSLDLNTVGNKSFIINYYYVTNGTYQNKSRSWIIYDSSGTDWSIKNFFDDLSTYIGSGMFGLDNFGLAILSFLFIFVFTGIMSYKFGISSPTAIMALILSVIIFLDVGVNILPNPIGAVPHFPVIIVSIIMVGMLIREGTR